MTAPLQPSRSTPGLPVLRRIPALGRLFLKLLRDARVSRLDRLLVLGSLAYAVFPIDAIPDFIPILGQTDDLLLIATAVSRLFDRAPQAVVAEHWSGDPEDLNPAAVSGLVALVSWIRRPVRKILGRS